MEKICLDLQKIEKKKRGTMKMKRVISNTKKEDIPNLVVVVVAVVVVVVLMFFDRNNKRTSKDSCYQNLSVCWLYDGMEWVPNKNKGLLWQTLPIKRDLLGYH